MKRKTGARGALCLCLALLLALPAAALTLGEPLGGYAAASARGTELARGVFWTGDDYRTENYITLAPDSAVYPVVVGGETLCSRGSLAQAAERLEAEGLHVLAGVNGDFFNMRSGIPAGVVVENGVLRSSCDGVWAVGFGADGSAVIGKPTLEMSLEIGGTRYPLTVLNKNRGAAFTLYTEDFAAKTPNDGAGRVFVCSLSDALRTQCETTLLVESCMNAEGAVEIPRGKAILSLSEDANEWLQTAADRIEAGDKLLLTVSCAEGWEDVTSAVGCLYKLITEGSVEEKLERTLSPRSAVGVKADGTLVLYTVDGRQSGLSVGASLQQVAERMLELGCVEAGALDGGASTSLCAVRPGETSLSQINSPSAGKPRDAANYILLVTEQQPANRADKLTFYPLEGLQMLVGASAPVSVKASDENGFAVLLPIGVRQAVSGGIGSLREGRFYAQQAGEGALTAAIGDLRASMPVHVARTPDKITVFGEKHGRVVKALTLDPGQEVDLRAEAELGHVRLIADDECFSWSLEPAAGTVDETGHLTASRNGGEGILTVSAGEKKLEIPITVLRRIPFTDVAEEDPYYEAVCYTYENELFSGVAEDRFAPLKTMNRAMIVTVLWRVAGKPSPEAEPVFEDVKPDSWYGEAVAWASETGVVDGVSETEFRPTGDLTREQITAMLCRYHRFVLGEEAESGAYDVFPDADEVSSWASESVGWAVGSGVLTARDDGKLQPGSPATRAEVAEMLMRYLG